MQIKQLVNTEKTPFCRGPYLANGLLFGLLFLGSIEAEAAKVPYSSDRLKTEATHIISGEVVSVSSNVQNSAIEKGPGINRDEVFKITLKVASVAKGNEVKAGEEIVLQAWKPATRIPPLPGLQGHDPLPKKGHLVTVYVERKQGDAFVPLMPNGMQIKGQAVLPEDPETPIITMDYAGGFRRVPQPKIGPDGRPIVEVPQPFLVIQADGTVLKSGKPVEAKKMTSDELKELLAFVVEENEFFEFNKAKVDAALKVKDEAFRKEQQKQAALGRPVAVGGLPLAMPTTMITVDLGEKKHTVRCYGYSMLARKHPGIEPVQQMNRIEQRLLTLAK